jgi:hypothetical protein
MKMEIAFTFDKQQPRKGRSVPRPASYTHATLRIPRISRLMALAIRFHGLLRDGSVLDQKTLAQLGGVTRSRVTQIMHLLHLAPDIQEELLFLPFSSRIVERTIRPIVRLVSWEEQRQVFAQAVASIESGNL